MIYLQGLSKEKARQVSERLAYEYPTWFFELYGKIKGKPIVLEDYQIRYLLDNSVFTITNKARQAGGSLMMAMKKFFRAYKNPGYRCDIVSINLKEAVDKIRYMRMLHDTLPLKYRVPLTIDNATSIGFHGGSKLSLIQSIAASTAVRGGSKEMVFDEFAHIALAEELFYAAAPAIINGDLTLDLISTPKGNIDMFSKIWWNNKNEEGERPFSMFSHHQFIWCDVKRFVTNYEEVQHVWHNEMHEDMSQMRQLVQAYGTDKLKFYYHIFPFSQFQQEFCGVFLDELTAFFPWDLIKKCLRGTVASADDMEEEALEKWDKRPDDNNNQVFMGVDFGESDKDTDKTSIQILERDGDILKHRYSEVLTKEKYPDFPSQATHIVDVAHRFRPQKISGDHTGLGRGVMPMLWERDGDLPLEEVNFNFASKEEMVMKLKGLMENGKIWLQAEDVQLQGQIRNIERKLTEKSGTASYGGKPYDDMFWALALAARAGAYTDFAIYQLGGKSSLKGVL